MLYRLMLEITDFGDLAVVLPTAAAALLWLCCYGRWHAARWWVAAVGGCILTIVLLKFALSKGHVGISIADFHSPSGHTAVSTMVYGSIAALAGAALGGKRGVAAILLGGAAVAAIALSRLYIGAHSVLEVIVGLLAGLLWAYVFFRYGYRREALGESRVLALVALTAGMALATHGWHMPTGRAVIYALLPPGIAARL